MCLVCASSKHDFARRESVSLPYGASVKVVCQLQRSCDATNRWSSAYFFLIIIIKRRSNRPQCVCVCISRAAACCFITFINSAFSCFTDPFCNHPIQYRELINRYPKDPNLMRSSQKLKLNVYRCSYNTASGCGAELTQSLLNGGSKTLCEVGGPSVYWMILLSFSPVLQLIPNPIYSHQFGQLKDKPLPNYDTLYCIVLSEVGVHPAPDVSCWLGVQKRSQCFSWGTSFYQRQHWRRGEGHLY